MLVVHATLLHGVIRAASADDLAMTDQGDPGEWPPSPARVVAALVAADGTRERCRVTTGTELALFERARPPRIHASPPSAVLRSRLQNRYVVINDRDKARTVQEYPARQAQLVRPGTRLCPADARVVYVWEDVTPSDEELRALKARAARIGYLGCADSPVRVGVATAFDPSAAPPAVWEPDPEGRHDLPIPFEGFVGVLDAMYDAWRTGAPARRSWYRAARARYRAPGEPPPRPPGVWGSTLWLRFEGSLPGRSALRVAETLKAAVLKRYQEHVAAGSGDIPAVLHGHGREGERGYQNAQWLVLPDVGHPHAQGRLHGAAVMLPRGESRDLVDGVREALWWVRELAVPGLAPIRVRLHGDEARPRAARPDRWVGPARRWVSALPVVHERRTRGIPTVEDVAAWCRHAGVPEPVRARFSPVPILPGSPMLRPFEVFRERDGVRRPFSHLEIEFAEPVRGPIVLGRARQYGMGLMAPVADDVGH